MKTQPEITIVVVQREGFSLTKENLQAIYEHTKVPFELVYVDANSPKREMKYLQQESLNRGFYLIRHDQFLFPNQARNLGLKYVKTPYVTFIDNDVIVSPGWLGKMLECAKDTGATVVGPLVCQYRPLHKEVHCAGGEAHIVVDRQGRRQLRTKLYLQGKKVSDVKHSLSRTVTEHAEFHCVLVKTSVFEELGVLDELMVNTQEHFDFCMSVSEEGGTIYFELDSIVTYVPVNPLKRWADLEFHMVRWNSISIEASLKHLQQKWELDDAKDIKHRLRSARNRGARSIIGPITQSLNLKVLRRPIRKIWVEIFDPFLSRYLIWTYQDLIYKASRGSDNFSRGKGA